MENRCAVGTVLVPQEGTSSRDMLTLSIFQYYNEHLERYQKVKLLPTLSSVSCSVTGFMLRSLIDLDLGFIHGDRYGTICILLPVDTQ